MHTVKCLHVLPFNSKYSIENYSFICTNRSNCCHLIPIIQFRYAVKEFQVMLCIINDSIKQSFVYTLLYCQTVLLLTIWFNVSRLFAHSLNVSYFNALIASYQVLLLEVRVDLWAMAMKGYPVFPWAPLIGASPSDGLKSYVG